MSIKFEKIENESKVAEFMAGSIWRELLLGKRVLFFVTGGSSIPVCVKIAQILREKQTERSGTFLKNLTVTLTDERYGEVGHSESNWQKLLEAGFDLPEARLVPVLTGKDKIQTVEDFRIFLKKAFETADYKIGIFGVGKDGHTAGMLPESFAVKCLDFACGYDAPPFFRVTICKEAILKLDEAVVFMQGKEKWGVVKDLLERDIDIKKQPAQILKEIPLLTIFGDYHGV